MRGSNTTNFTSSMKRSFMIFMIGMLVLVNIIIGYIPTPDNGSEVFISVVAGMFTVAGILGLFQTKK